MPLLIVAVVCGLIGGFMAQSKNKNVFLWFILCAFFPVIGIIVLAILAPERSSGNNFITAPNRTGPRPTRYSSVQRTASQDRYDRARWAALIEVDDEIGAVEREVAAYGQDYAEELAEKYLALNDKTYLSAIRDKIVERAEIDRHTRDNDEAKKRTLLGERVQAAALAVQQQYQLKCDANEGRDPKTNCKILSSAPYDGPIRPFQGGIRVDLEGGGIGFITGTMERYFRSEDDLKTWAGL